MTPNNNVFALLTAINKESVVTPQYLCVPTQLPTRTAEVRCLPHAQVTTHSMKEESSNFWLAEIRRRNAHDLSLKRRAPGSCYPYGFDARRLRPATPRTSDAADRPASRVAGHATGHTASRTTGHTTRHTTGQIRGLRRPLVQGKAEPGAIRHEAHQC